MKLTFISDTHSRHHGLALGDGDVLVHCGDFTSRGTLSDTLDFAGFLSKQAFTHKIVIAGNHDHCFEDDCQEEAESILKAAGIVYLNDEGIDLDGVKFWGSPIQPEFFNWAFNRKRGTEIRQHWKKIPHDTDVLITHGPPFGILDRCADGTHVGCEDLLNTVKQIKPRIHAFGHIHESYGMREEGGIQFVNACTMNGRYIINNLPIERVI